MKELRNLAKEKIPDENFIGQKIEELEREISK